MLLQVFYSIRSERQLMEQIQYNLLFHWFDGLAMDDAAWLPMVFSKNVIGRSKQHERPLKASEPPKMDRKLSRCHINLGLITIDQFYPSLHC